MGLALSRYRAAVDALFARTAGGVKPGLERTEALLAAVGDPHRRLRAFHVAGTNGKGSVCATLDALLRAKGLRVGRYTSPHLVDFRERILVDGRPISEDAVADWLTTHDALIERLAGTFFEATTALAFDYFVSAGVDVAVVETGLGGRLDSTNVLQPIAATVTSIGLDHTELLGSTIEQIATEKAGIFKRGAPALVGERDAKVARFLREKAIAAGASEALAVNEDWRVESIDVSVGATAFTLVDSTVANRFGTPLMGEHQAYNAALAIMTLRVAGAAWTPTLDELSRGLRTVRLPGRFQQIGNIVFDVAHNPAGAAVLATTLERSGVARPITAFVSVLADKDWRGIIRELARVADRFVLTTAPSAPTGRVWNIEDAYAFARAERLAADMSPDFSRALDAATRHEGTVVVTGSFHTVGDAMACLQVDPLAG
ncbi:MAG: bifunctional folylpolyglutamate synthase/dihydrofolate synthase [Gemmatimonadaceae bacterium]